MSIASSLKSFIPLVIGVSIGAVGASLFKQSMPGAEGSPEEQVARLEVELKRANNRVAALQEAHPERRGSGREFRDGVRDVFDDLRAGRPVTPDDLLRVSKPLIRDFSPLFDRIRVRQQKQMIDSMSGEIARKYDLTEDQQGSLKAWFERKIEADAKAWSDLVTAESTTVEDMAEASRNVRPDEGLDEFMAGVLSGDKLTDFQDSRMAERAERVQREADARVQRLDNIVGLDDAQRDQVFGIMARGSRDYDPGMRLEGIGGDIGTTPGGDTNAAMLSVLRPDQRESYETERQRRRDEAVKEMEEIGLTMPVDWDPLDF
ncbi:hypothetical protein [Luteolibacter marinus]|uniref:hypothetical protein n=1 Tax=Luteolibacter marinus TaxID=2776705 RepID=UPI0018681C17|nr:hypothetical protein [Luteolibacter marinus]